MSILMKKPRIEEIADALGDAKKTLLSVLDGPGEYARFDLEKGPLPVGGAPLVRRSILSYKGREYPGVYLRTSLGSHFIEVSGKEECATYEVDEANRSLRKVDEPLSAEELRRVLGGSSGGGSGLPDDYAASLQSLIQFSGTKTEVGGDLEVDGNATFAGKNCFVWHGTVTDEIEGMSISSTVSGLFFHGTVLSVEGQTSEDPGIFALIAVNDDGLNFYFEKPLHYDPSTKEARPATVEEILSGNWSPYLSLDGGIKVLTDRSDGRLSTLSVNKLMGSENEPVIDWMFKVEGENISLGEIARAAKKVKYQHTVTISGEGFEFCFTAPSSKNIVIDSYEDLGVVFGGKRIGLTGYSHALSAKPVLIDLHGGSVSNDFIRTFDENGNTFANHTLSSLGSITFADDVYIPN